MKTVSQLKRKKWLAAVFAASLAIVSVQIAGAQDNEIKEAKHFQELDQPKKALDALTKAATTYPSSPEVFYELGKAQLKAGKRSEARASFDKGIAAASKDKEGEALNLAGKGMLNMMENNAQKAKIDFDNALSLTKSKNAKVLMAVAEGYLVDKKMAGEAINLLTKAKSVDKENAAVMVMLGDAYLAENPADGGRVVSAYESAAMLDPKNARSHYKTGLIYLRSRNFDAATEAFQKAISIDPNYTLAYKEQGELFYQLKRGPEAVKAYEKFLSLTETPEKYQSRMAFYYLAAENFQKANELFDQLMAKDSSTAYIYRYAAITKFQLKNYPSAETTFDNYFKIAKPEAVEAVDYSYAGKVALAQEKDSVASEYFKKSLEKDPKQPELYQLLADSYYGQKKFPEAIEAFENLFEYKKASSADYYTLGRAYYFNEQFDKADSAFATLTELQPTMTVGPFWQARSKAAQDSTSENGLAKPYYEKLVEKALVTPDKAKTELVESYMYLGYYNYLKGQTSSAKQFYQKVLAIDPSNEKAKVAINALTAAQQQPKPKGGG